jgi:hypothetical protein
MTEAKRLTAKIVSLFGEAVLGTLSQKKYHREARKAAKEWVEAVRDNPEERRGYEDVFAALTRRLAEPGNDEKIS